MVRNATTPGLLTLAFLGSIGRVSHAEPAGRLSYERGPGAETCPDEAALRRAVAARLGEDPFDPASSRTFRLRISAGSRLHGSVEAITNGAVEGRRELESEPDACAELVEAMALAVSLTINPELVVEPAPSREEPPAPPPANPPPAPLVSPASPKRSPQHDRTAAERSEPRTKRGKPLTLAVGALAHGAVGTGPGVAVGGSALVRAGGDWWHVGLEGRVDALSQAGIGRNGTVHSTLLAAVLAPCARYGAVSGCPLLLLGSMFARSRGVAREDSDRGFFAATGGRLSTGGVLSEHLLLEARVDVLYALTPVTIELDGAPVWQARASGALGVGLVWEFP